MKIKPESEISSHITLTSVITGYSTLDIFTEVLHNVLGVHNISDIIATPGSITSRMKFSYSCTCNLRQIAP